MRNLKVEAMLRTMPWKWIIIAGTSFIFTACALIIFAGGAQGKGPAGNISAMIEPQEIHLGNAAVLAVHVTGEQAGTPSITAVEGLRFIPMGQSSRYQSINGRISSIVSYLFQVQPEHEGEFTLPPVTVSINGQIRQTEPICLSVSGSGSARVRPSAPTLPPPAPQAPKQEKDSGLTANEQNQPAFLRVTPLKHRAYVGELVPVEIQAFFRQGLQATLNSLPMFSGDAFACQGLSKKPQQTETVIDGVPYALLTWHTAMSAVKEGEFPVSVELDATLLIPQTSRRRHSPFGRGFFDDDFFDNFFASIREEKVKLASPRQKMRVLPLPKAGRPKNFSGAVGRFKLWATANPKKGMVGDPITVKMTVKGQGNFDRVSSPLLASSKGWRTYTPTTSFKPADSVGYKGKRSFEQAIIPLDAPIKKVPPFVFSYFDTRKEKYVTLRTQPMKVAIAADTQQARASSAEDSGGGKPVDPASDLSGLNKKSDGLAPIHVDLGPVTTSLKPVFDNPWFIGTQGIPLGALFIGLFLGRRNQRLSNDPAILRQKHVRQKINKSIKEMDRAIAGHDVSGFFNACRSAAQERLGEVWTQAPESITLAEVKNRLTKDSAGIRHVFENADAVAYSGRTFSQEELRECRDLVVKELKNLRS